MLRRLNEFREIKERIRTADERERVAARRATECLRELRTALVRRIVSPDSLTVVFATGLDVGLLRPGTATAGVRDAVSPHIRRSAWLLARIWALDRLLRRG